MAQLNGRRSCANGRDEVKISVELVEQWKSLVMSYFYDRMGSLWHNDGEHFQWECHVQTLCTRITGNLEQRKDPTKQHRLCLDLCHVSCFCSTHNQK